VLQATDVQNVQKQVMSIAHGQKNALSLLWIQMDNMGDFVASVGSDGLGCAPTDAIAQKLQDTDSQT